MNVIIHVVKNYVKICLKVKVVYIKEFNGVFLLIYPSYPMINYVRITIPPLVRDNLSLN